MSGCRLYLSGGDGVPINSDVINGQLSPDSYSPGAIRREADVAIRAISYNDCTRVRSAVRAKGKITRSVSGYSRISIVVPTRTVSASSCTSPVPFGVSAICRLMWRYNRVAVDIKIATQAAG